MKQCTRCRKEGIGPKPLSEFGTDTQGYPRSKCRPCLALEANEWAKKNPGKNRVKNNRYNAAHPDRLRRSNIEASLRRYGLTPEEYAERFAAQGGKCKICERTMLSRLQDAPTLDRKGEVAHLDHCHKTGKIRGFLCVNCNSAIGKLRDSEQLLLNAIRYLRESVTE